MGVSANELSEALLTRVIAAAGQVMRKPHGVAEAEVSLDSFAKALYDRLFTWQENETAALRSRLMHAVTCL